MFPLALTSPQSAIRGKKANVSWKPVATFFVTVSTAFVSSPPHVQELFSGLVNICYKILLAKLTKQCAKILCRNSLRRMCVICESTMRMRSPGSEEPRDGNWWRILRLSSRFLSTACHYEIALEAHLRFSLLPSGFSYEGVLKIGSKSGWKSVKGRLALIPALFHVWRFTHILWRVCFPLA